ncbi:hypothetical protein L3X38_015747 [Prunus dulcis]|uniref:Uncharacterized protein n=1 Tax=Prunus dulcis TaxID=3755 RepID=A0AAD4W3Y3_PRUDU|nr:hypothetical protein L3X38_015747 [Prunus dulcis]
MHQATPLVELSLSTRSPSAVFNSISLTSLLFLLLIVSLQTHLTSIFVLQSAPLLLRWCVGRCIWNLTHLTVPVQQFPANLGGLFCLFAPNPQRANQNLFIFHLKLHFIQAAVTQIFTGSQWWADERKIKL